MSSAENRYQPGQIVCYQGEAMRFLYILKSGSVDVIYNDPADRPLSLEILETRGQRVATIEEPGALVGEMGALLKIRSATIRAGVEGAVLQPIPVSEDGLAKAIKTKPSLGVRLARTMAQRARDNNDRTRRLLALVERIRSGSQDFARRFYELSERLGGVYRGRPSMMTLVKVTQATTSFEQGKLARRPRSRSEDVFEGRDSPELEQLRDPSHSGPTSTIELERDDVLFRRGDAGDSLYVVLDGSLQSEFDDQPPNTVEKGGIVGEMAVLLDETVRSETVRATARSRLLVVRRDRFAEVVENLPEIVLGLVRILAERLKSSNSSLFEGRQRLTRQLETLGEVVEDFQTFRRRLEQHREQPIDICEALDADLVAARKYREDMDAACRDALREGEIPRRRSL